MHVYRGFGEKTKDLHNLKPGHTIHDKGFTSTSIDHKQAHKFGSIDKDGYNTLAKIHVPAGTKGHYVDSEHYGHFNHHEKEFLLHPVTHFKVTHHSTDHNTKTHFIHMTIHKQDEHE
jgi:hypothetical protein